MKDTVALVTSDTFINAFPQQLYNTVIAIFPLLLLGDQGRGSSRDIVKLVASSDLSRRHKFLANVSELVASDCKYQLKIY